MPSLSIPLMFLMYSPCLSLTRLEAHGMGYPFFSFFQLWLQNQTQSKGLSLWFFSFLVLFLLYFQSESATNRRQYHARTFTLRLRARRNP